MQFFSIYNALSFLFACKNVSISALTSLNILTPGQRRNDIACIFHLWFIWKKNLLDNKRTSGDNVHSDLTSSHFGSKNIKCLCPFLKYTYTILFSIFSQFFYILFKTFLEVNTRTFQDFFNTKKQ